MNESPEPSTPKNRARAGLYSIIISIPFLAVAFWLRQFDSNMMWIFARVLQTMAVFGIVWGLVEIVKARKQ